MQTRTDERRLLTVTDLKQYFYCPRVVYYTYCLPLIRPTTFKMARGTAAHERARGKAQRRTLSAYGLERGQRHFDVSLVSPTLGLSGRVDMVIETEENPTGAKELIPVEYKHSRRQPGANWKRQLAAYGLMLEEAWGAPVRRGFFYSLITRRAEACPLTATLRKDVVALVEQMHTMIAREVMPPPPKRPSRCVDCEFRRFCNDVL